MTGIFRVVGRGEDNKPLDRRTAYTDVWIKRDGRRQVLSSQGTDIKWRARAPSMVDAATRRRNRQRLIKRVLLERMSELLRVSGLSRNQRDECAGARSYSGLGIGIDSGLL